jgi:branched-chain amino acid transport system ATP-binding protein
MMVALLLYAYGRGVYSSRRIVRACEERLDFEAATALNQPDFRTISEFRRRHLDALAGPCVQVLTLCRRIGRSGSVSPRRRKTRPERCGQDHADQRDHGRPSAGCGEILFRGKSIRRLPPHRRNRLGISRSFQILSLFGEMTVDENIRNTVLRYRGLHISPRRLLRRLDTVFAEVAAVAEMVGLGRALQERADNLPYGMQRRLDIALVLAQQPELIILDEPAAGLSAAETRDLIAVLQATIGKRTLILVEHDMDVIYALSDRITVLDYGQVLTEGTPAEINANPDVRRVYLGEAAA